MKTPKLTRRNLLMLPVWAALILLAYCFLPNTLGGSTGYVVVAGQSMEPTYHTGDLLITRAAPVKKGDVIVYKVRDGELGAGMSVVHRVVGGDASKGWLTQGDNNPSIDPWLPKGDEISGTVAYLLPKAGYALIWIKSPIVIALLGGITVCIILWPSKEEQKEKKPTRREVVTLNPAL